MRAVPVPSMRNLAELSSAQGSYLLSIYLMVLFCLFMTHADIWLSTAGYIGSWGTLLFPGIMLPCMLMLLVSPDAEQIQRRAFQCFVENGLPLWMLLAWAMGRGLLLGPFSFDQKTVDATHFFALFHVVTVLFGIALTTLPGAETASRRAATLALLVLGATVVIDVLYPGTFSVKQYRPAGLPTDANITAFNLMLLLSLAVPFGRLRGRSLLLIATAFAFASLTFSRGGLLLCMVFAVVYTTSLRTRAGVHVGLPVLLGFAVAIVTIVSLLGFVVQDTALSEQKVAVERLSALGLQSDPLADDYRPALFDYYLGLALQHPFAGYGTGYTLGHALLDSPFGVGPHNNYLREWVDNGLWGLLTYVGVLAALGLTFVRRHFIPGIAVVAIVALHGLFSHTLMDDKTSLLTLGMMLGRSVAPQLRNAEDRT